MAFYKCQKGETLQLVPWNTGTDSQIAAMINAYYNGDFTLADIQSVWSVGDVREVTIDAIAATGSTYSSLESHRSQVVQVQILDFNHDVTSIDGRNVYTLLTVDLKNCLRDSTVTDITGSANTENGIMNSLSYNGWKNCSRRYWCNEGFYNALPSYMRDLVKSVEKKSTKGSKSTSFDYTNDYIFIPSTVEYSGSQGRSVKPEGVQYALYRNAPTNIRKMPGWNDTYPNTSIVWTRSSSNSNYNFCNIIGELGGNESNVSAKNGIAPAWCL